MIQHLTEIVDEARKRGNKRLAVAYGQDSHTLEAVYEAYKEGIVEPTLFGEKKVIEQVCAENDIDIKAFNIVDEASDVKCVQQAVAAVVAGNADVLMKGLVSTDKYMRGILNKEAGLFPPKGVLSHVSIVEMPCYSQTAGHLDVAVIPLPDFKQRRSSRSATLQKSPTCWASKPPRSPASPPPSSCSPASFHRPKAPYSPKWATADKAGQCLSSICPLSLDAALCCLLAAKVKGSSVAGDPDCLFFSPNPSRPMSSSSR